MYISVLYTRTCNIVFPHGKILQLSTSTKYRFNKITLSKLSLKHLFYKTKLLPPYNEFKLLNLNNIFRLEVLKLMCKFKTNFLPKCFSDFFEIPSNVHSYSTRYASSDSYFLMRFKNTISQRLMRYVGPKL